MSKTLVAKLAEVMGKLLLRRQIEQEVSVERQLLPWATGRHRFSPYHGVHTQRAAPG